MPWGTINREQIIEAAERAVRSGRYQQMTIRSLAADLGASPMALYHHVRDKDDILDQVVDRLLARAWKPKIDPAHWRDWIIDAAGKLRHLLVSQPAALHVYLTHPVTSPAALARMDSVMAVLRRALGDEQAARRAYAAIHTYTIGFAALQASRASQPIPQDSSPSNETPDRRSRRKLQQPVSKDPELGQLLAAYTNPEQFQQGLKYLLDGIEHGHRR